MDLFMLTQLLINLISIELPILTQQLLKCLLGGVLVVLWLSDGLRNRSKRVALLRSLSGKYPWERYEPPYPPSYGLNSTTTVLLGEWLWH